MPYLHDKISTKKVLTAVQADPNAKTKKAAEYPELVLETHFALSRFFDYALTKASAYNVSLWVWSWNNYVTLKGQFNHSVCRPGDIVDVDFGSNSYGDEFIFRHPGIVICECKNKVFLVPCSSSFKQGRDKDGNLYPEAVIIPGGAGLEFSKLTVALPYNARFVDKTRILLKTGVLNSGKFEELKKVLFTHMFADKDAQIRDLEKIKADLESKSSELDVVKKNLETALSEQSTLKQEFQELKQRHQELEQQLQKPSHQ